MTQKRYQIELYLQCPTNRKSYMIYRTAPFQWPWTSRSLTLNISETVRDADIVSIGTYSAVSFRKTLSDRERLSKIFNDTKRRASCSVLFLICVLAAHRCVAYSTLYEVAILFVCHTRLLHPNSVTISRFHLLVFCHSVFLKYCYHGPV